MSCSIEMIGRSNSRASSSSCGAAGAVARARRGSRTARRPACRPAMRARSTAASVCPARRSTPPSLATSGNRCPGRVKSAGLLVGSQIARIVRARSAAVMPVRRRAVIDRHGVVGAQRGGVRLDHRRQLEPLAHVRQDRHAELPAAVGDHEVDRLGRHLLGGADEVALVLAVLGVDDDDHPALADGLDGFFDGGELRWTCWRHCRRSADRELAAAGLGCRRAGSCGCRCGEYLRIL